MGGEGGGGGIRMHIGYWWESQKERDHYEDQDVVGLKWILERWDDMDWIVMAQVTDQRRALYEHGNEPCGSVKCWEVLE
jgi:hypothetical protein